MTDGIRKGENSDAESMLWHCDCDWCGESVPTHLARFNANGLPLCQKCADVSKDVLEADTGKLSEEEALLACAELGHLWREARRAWLERK